MMDFHENEEIPKLKPDNLMQELLDLLVIESGITGHSFMMARVAMLICVLLAVECIFRIDGNDINNSLLAYGQSSMMLGTGMALGGAYFRKDSLSSNARRANEVRLANDPKQAEKINVCECWDEWQKQPDRYKGKAAFARDMLNKYESLESHRVIERWCKEWESVPS